MRFRSKVVHGFGRGSTDLGIPTANLSREDATCSSSSQLDFDDLPTGIYWGFARIGKRQEDVDNDTSYHGSVYKAAISIGYNPTYGNEEKTVEPHLIAPPTHARRHASSCGETLLRDFYEEPIRLSVVGYLRPELPFEGLDKLIVAIKNDIVNAEKLGDGTDEVTLRERAWVGSDED